VNHSYTTPGVYTVTLTLTTSNGLMDTDTIEVKVAAGETLAQYVNACKTQVGFNTLPDINCYDGILFAESGVDGEEDNLGATRDFVGYRRINNDVDLAVACRWLGGDRENPINAASVEMLVHNRVNGNTCFFSAKANSGSPDANINVASILASPTAPNATNFWDDPAHVDGSGRRCVECHVAGPIIASPRVVDELGIFGLLNNGHDTFATRYKAVTPPGGGAFSFWNEIVQDNNVADNCSSGCHTVGHNSTISDVLFIRPVLLPSISTVIDKIGDAGVMPPNGTYSPYRWINRDSINGPGDQETFAESKAEYPALLEYCGAPTFIEAHAVGSDVPDQDDGTR
jgi:PKD repeat protein